MSKKPSYVEDWQTRFHVKLQSAEEAVRAVKPGHRVFLATGCAQPVQLVRALTMRAAELADVEINQLFTLGPAPYASKSLAASFRVNNFFVAENVRDIIQEGYGSYTPALLSNIPRLFSSGRIPLDATLLQVSPPDEHGMCSLGISVDIVKVAAENSKIVIAQVNPQMPRTQGDSLISIYDFDSVVAMETPIVEMDPMDLTEDVRRIGEYVAALIEDGSTIQIGIGVVTQAAMEKLQEKKDLGIHTEMITDTIIDLMESGVINGRRKSLDRGKVVASFCMGTRRLYDYVDNNPAFSFRPTQYVNDPNIISRQNRMVAINTAVEVDLTGQVCADSVGNRFISGAGGQSDFNRGASLAPHGKSIIALPSTAKEGSISRIVPQLTPGAGVVTTRSMVHYVITEFGTAYLYGKSIQERAMALISIAHPEYRADLLKKAIELKYLLPDMAAVEGKLFVEPPGLRTSMVLNDGTLVKFRPIHPTDEPRMRELFYALSEGTIYYRFGAHLKRLPQKQIQDFVYVDNRTEVTIVGYVPSAHGDEIISLGAYYLDKKTNRAEVALVTRDDWQNKSIGGFMMKYLARIARQNGIHGFTAEIHFTNKPMQLLMNKGGQKVSSKLNGSIYSFETDF